MTPCPVCGATEAESADCALNGCPYGVTERTGPGVYRALVAYAEIGADMSLHPEREPMVHALRRIVQWADAYPLDVFPEPDFALAAEALKGAGMTLDAISASNMRHAIKGVGAIARAALADYEAAHSETEQAP